MSSPTLVVLHGWGHSKERWTDFAGRMAPETSVTAFDLPGFGAEPLPDANWQIPDYAAWVTSKIVELGLTDVVLLGHSFGGRVSAYIAAQRPSWLRGLVLYAAPCLDRPSTRVRWQNRVMRIVGKLPVPERLRIRIRGHEDREARASGLGAVWRRVLRFDQTATLPNIAVPTLLLWGERDTEVPLAIARELQTLIPNAVLEVIPGAGHTAHIDEHILFYGLVQAYLAKLQSSGSVA